MSTSFIWRFTPSQTDPNMLEQIFVQRGTLVDDLVANIRDSVITGSKHYQLLVGPRGFGKTHIVTMVRNRVAANAELHDRMRIAWLNEDETTTSFTMLLVRICKALTKEYPGEFPDDEWQRAYELDTPEALHFLQDFVLKCLAGRTLLLLVENLDLLFEGLGDDGQKAWRAMLQEKSFMTILATSQQLFNAVSRRTSPFYGTFQIEHLKPLDIKDATQLLINLAELHDDKATAAFLRTSEGRSRVRALHHLSGGNHRVYIILSEFMDQQSLDTLIMPLQQTIDELTPYYQERLRSLSPQQKAIVEYLCTRRVLTPVKEVARRQFMSEQTASKQLGQLIEKGYVKRVEVGRESRYELTEPLMRLALEVKDQRQGPLQLIVDFLRIWYQPQQLLEWMACLPESAIDAKNHVQAAIIANSASGDPRINAILADVELLRTQGRYKELIEVLEDLTIYRGNEKDWKDLSRCEIQYKNYEAAAIYQKNALNINPNSVFNWSSQGCILLLLEKNEEALSCFEKALSLDSNFDQAWIGLGITLYCLGRIEDALKSFNKALNLNPNSAQAAFLRLNCLFYQNLWEIGFHDLEKAFVKHWPNKQNTVGDVPLCLANIIYRSHSQVDMQNRVSQLVNIFYKASALEHLGVGLVQSLKKLENTMLSNSALESWLVVWEKVGANYKELEVSLRLFRVGIKYLISRDERVLFDLLEHERILVREALGLK